MPKRLQSQQKQSWFSKGGKKAWAYGEWNVAQMQMRTTEETLSQQTTYMTYHPYQRQYAFYMQQRDIPQRPHGSGQLKTGTMPPGQPSLPHQSQGISPSSLKQSRDIPKKLATKREVNESTIRSGHQQR
jgi:hypothetical protein